MSGTKDQFIDEQERICDDYAAGMIDHQDAMIMLMGMGFDRQEAFDLLTGAIA